MGTEASGHTDSVSRPWARPAMIWLSLLVVLAPLLVVTILARVTRLDALAFLGIPISFLLAWWMLRLRGERWAGVELRPAPSWRRLLLVVGVAVPVLLVGTAILASALAAATGLAPDLSRFDMLRGDPAVLAVGLVVVWTSAAFGEELVFRGFVMHTLHRLLHGGVHWHWVWAVLLTSGLFGLAHAYQGAAGAILTGVIGLGYALAYFACRRSLWAAILAHGLYDTIGLLIVFLNLDRPSAAA
jgi:membrane protease YdiL (CAAX protease family)